MSIDLSQVLAQRAAFAEALAGELGARLGREPRIEPGRQGALGVLELVDSDEPVVHQQLPFASGEGAVHVVLPQRDGKLFAALEQSVAADALDAALAADLDAPRCAALGQVLQSVSDVMRRSFESAGWPELSTGDLRLIPQPQSDPTWIDDTVYVRLRFSLTFDGLAPGQLDVLLRKSDLAGEAPLGQSVCFVTLGEAERKRISALEADLGASAVTVEPRELMAALDERVLSAALVVVPLELAGRSGLELVESLAPRIGRGRIALGLPRATRALVAAALRAGAAAVVSHPYEAAQIRSASETAKA